MNIILIIFSLFITILLLLFLILFIKTNGNYGVLKTLEQDLSIPHIKVNNYLFHTETFGDSKNPIVFILHGGPGNDFKYLLSLKELSDKYFIVFYDQRGTGLSPRVPRNELTLEQMLIDLDDIIHYFKPKEKVNIIGHSWGAMLGSGYLCRNPEKVKGIVLAEPGLLTSDKAKEYYKIIKSKSSIKLFGLMISALIRSMHVKGPDKHAKKDFMFTDLFLGISPEVNPLRDYYCEGNVPVLDFWRYGWEASVWIPKNNQDKKKNIKIDLVSGLDKYDDEVLFLTGKCNKIIGPDYQKGHIKYFKNIRVEIIKNAGHLMFIENKDDSFKVVREYLDKINY